MEFLVLLLWFGCFILYIWLSTSTDSIYDKPTALWFFRFVLNKMVENNAKLTIFGKIIFIPIHAFLFLPIIGTMIFIFIGNTLEFFVKKVLYKRS